MRDKSRNKYKHLNEIGKLSQQIIQLEKSGIYQKNVEEERGKLLKVIEIAKKSINIISPDGVIFYTNSAMDQLFGYKKGELIGKHASILNAGSKPEVVTEKIMAEIKKNEYWEGEIHSRRKDATEFISYAKINALKNKKGKILNYISTQHDIAERKREEAKLREAEEKLKKQNLRNKLIPCTALDGSFLLYRKGTILEANKSAAEILGYPFEKIVGMNIRDLEANENAQEVKKHINKGIKKRFDRFETKLWNKKGKIVELRVSTRFFEQGGNKHFFTFFHDIIKSKETDHELRERKKELETKSSNLKELNITLKVLLKKREEDKAELEKSILFNTKQLVEPYLEKLKKSGLNKIQENYLKIIESNIGEIVSPLSRKIASCYINFTPGEIRVANLVRLGKTNKEISELLNSSPRTIAFHRENIRRKLGLKNKKINLTTHLLSIT